MRALKIATIVMGVLIMVGTIGLIIGIARRASVPAVTAASAPAAGSPQTAAAVSASVAAILDEPAGTHIAGITAVRDCLAVRLEGGGADRVVLIDLATGAVAGRVSLAR